MRGPGVSGIPFFWYKTAPRVPPVFSHTVMVPVPGLNTLTQSEKSENLKFVLSQRISPMRYTLYLGI